MPKTEDKPNDNAEMAADRRTSIIASPAFPLSVASSYQAGGGSQRQRRGCSYRHFWRSGIDSPGVQGPYRAGGGGSLPPSARIFMFSSACVNLVRRASLSAARA